MSSSTYLPFPEALPSPSVPELHPETIPAASTPARIITVIFFILCQNLLHHFLFYNYTGQISKNLLRQTQIFKDFFEICLVYCFCWR